MTNTSAPFAIAELPAQGRHFGIQPLSGVYVPFSHKPGQIYLLNNGELVWMGFSKHFYKIIPAAPSFQTLFL